MLAGIRKHGWLGATLSLFLIVLCWTAALFMRLNSQQQTIDTHHAVLRTLDHLDATVQAFGGPQPGLHTSGIPARDAASNYDPQYAGQMARLKAARMGSREAPSLARVDALVRAAMAQYTGTQREGATDREWAVARNNADRDLAEAAVAVKHIISRKRSDHSVRLARHTKDFGVLIRSVWVAYLLFFASAILFYAGRIIIHLPEEGHTAPLAPRMSDVYLAWERFFDHAFTGMALIDPSGSIVRANPALQKILGFSASELRERTLADLAPTHTLGVGRLRRVDQSVDDVAGEVLQGKNGKTVFGRVQLTQFSLDARHCLAVVEDLTEQFAATEVRREAEARVRELERIKQTLVGNISHELRTPLAVVMGYADLLASEVPTEQQSHVQAIRHGGGHMLKIVENLLEFSEIGNRARPITLRSIDVRQPVTDAIAKIKFAAQEKNIRLAYHGDVAPIMVEADEVGLQRVAVHLLENAIKFTDEGVVQIHIVQHQGSVQIHVCDTGRGIEKAKLPHLYEAFRQGSEGNSRLFGGLGIGLSITHQLVQQMGGHLTVESEEGKGSRFTVSFARPNTGTGTGITVRAKAA